MACASCVVAATGCRDAVAVGSILVVEVQVGQDIAMWCPPALPCIGNACRLAMDTAGGFLVGLTW